MIYEEIKIKSAIREGIVEGMLIAGNIHVRENPYSAGEFIDQHQKTLNALTEKTFINVTPYLDKD